MGYKRKFTGKKVGVSAKLSRITEGQGLKKFGAPRIMQPKTVPASTVGVDKFTARGSALAKKGAGALAKHFGANETIQGFAEQAGAYAGTYGADWLTGHLKRIVGFKRGGRIRHRRVRGRL